MSTTTSDPILATFRKMDKDGDGYITKTELKELFRSSISNEADLSIKNALVDHMMRLADGDGNGKVDYEEFKEMMK